MRQKTILIVEDDEHISKLISYNLEKEDFLCQEVETGEDAVDYLQKNPVDLVILDLMLPGMNGLDVCKAIKQDKELRGIPVLMLTAKGEEIDRIMGFESGADDYLVKPFSPREFVLRVKAVLRRSQTEAMDSDILAYQNIKVNLQKHKVFLKDKEIKLTAMEFKLLVAFIQRKGRLQSREKLLKDVWSFDADVTTRTVDTHVKRLRQKLGRDGENIETVRGYGYRLKEEDDD